MFCTKCSILAILESNDRTCVRCQGAIINNLSCICDACSNEHRMCSVCLKTITIGPAPRVRGCGCGKK